MKHRIIKLLSIIMCVCICVTFTPIFTFADDGTSGDSGAPGSVVEPPQNPSTPAGGESGDGAGASSGVNEGNGQNTPNGSGNEEIVGGSAGNTGGNNIYAIPNATNEIGNVAPDNDVQPQNDPAPPAPSTPFSFSVLFNGIHDASLINPSYYVVLTWKYNIPIYDKSTEIQPLRQYYPDTITQPLYRNNAVTSGLPLGIQLTWSFSTIGERINVDSIQPLASGYDPADYEITNVAQYNYNIKGYKYNGTDYVHITPFVGDDSPMDRSIANNYTKIPKKTKSQASYVGDSSPQTGDDFNIGLLILICMLALAGTGTATLVFRRTNK